MASSTRFLGVTWIAAAAAVALGGTWILRQWDSRPAAAPAYAPLIQLQDMGQLASVKLNFSDVIEFTERRSLGIPWTLWELHLGGTNVLLVARGDCLVGPDLRNATYEQVDQTARTLVVHLQDPQPISVRVNHEPREKGGSYIYAVSQRGLEPLLPGTKNRIDAINKAFSVAQTAINRACVAPDVIALAKRNAESVLTPAFQALGWNATFAWGKQIAAASASSRKAP